MRHVCWLSLVLLTLSEVAIAASPSREEALARMQPYQGEAVQGVDVSTLSGKVMCGYQGWFNAPGDGSGRGWVHYGRGRFEPGQSTIDLWPDISDLDDDEKFATSFRHADGSVAYVFSSHCRKTVLRHFQWMKEYGIDGAFVQRFGVSTIGSDSLNHCSTILAHCREGANRNGRTYDVPMQIGMVEKRIADIYRRKFGDEANQKDLPPVTHAAKGKHIPPFLILHVADHPETKAQSERLAKALQEAGVSARAYPAEGKNHGTINADLGVPGDKPTQALFEFLNAALKK